MRALIRHLKTGLFYAGDWRWTAKREKACDFGTTFQALTYAEDNHLRGTEVVLTFGESEYDLTVSTRLKVGRESRHRLQQSHFGH